MTAWAQTDRVTIFLEHDQDAANPWNVSAFDGVELTVPRDDGVARHGQVVGGQCPDPA